MEIAPPVIAVNGIDPFHPLRPAIAERDALTRVFNEVRTAVRQLRSEVAAILRAHPEVNPPADF